MKVSVALIAEAYRKRAVPRPTRSRGCPLTAGSTAESRPRSAGRLGNGAIFRSDPRTPTLSHHEGDEVADLLIGEDFARGRGLSIPQDIALIGFGDLDVAALLDPALTTVALPAYQMGLQAMTMLRRLVAGERFGRVLSPPSRT
jgi:hypothetical protein